MTKEEFIDQYEHKRPYLEWCTGGMGGGNCWGDDPSEIYPDDEPSTDLLLEDFLINFDQQISYQEYQSILDAPGLVITKEWTDSEYYGNYYYRNSKTIDLDVIWPFIEFILDVPDSDVRKAHYILMED